MAVSDRATIRNLQSGQIASVKRASLDNVELATPPSPPRTTTSPSSLNATTVSVKPTVVGTNKATGATSALSDSDKRWLSLQPADAQKQVLSLSPAEITAKKQAGTWLQYQAQISNRANADALARIDGQVVRDTITGLPKAAKDVTTGCIQGTGQVVTTLGEFDNPVTAANTYASSLQRGDGQTAGKVFCKNIGAAAIAVAPVGEAATAGTRAVRLVDDAANAGRVIKSAESAANAARFSDKAALTSHYVSHGRDFGAASAAEYETLANRFLTGPTGNGVLTKIRANGDVVRYNPTTNEFGVTSKDGIIRTYFKPNPTVHGYPTNLDYFYAQ